MQRSVLLILATLIVVLAPRLGRAQSTGSEITFDKLVHDFGTLKEEQGEATYTFNYKNTGTAPLKLVDVKASCGCTTPSWTRDAVATGQVGTITATYSTVSRPGEFTKTITVRAKAENVADERVLVLTIKGNVTPKVKTVADFYPHKSGSLRYNTNHVAVSRLNPGKVSVQEWKIFNEGEAPVTLRSMGGAPAHVTSTFVPGTVIKAKDTLKVKFTFDGGKVNDWGWVYTPLTMDTDDSAEPSKSMYVSAMVEEDFSAWSAEQKASAPVLSFEATSHDFGKITSGKVVTTDFKFTNSGKSDLLIRKTKASCGCTASQPDKTVLKPGESSFIKVSYDSTGKKGKDTKVVTVITNDPNRSTVNLQISAESEAAAAPGGSN
jgi:Protein of unknown function (DUF1573)